MCVTVDVESHKKFYQKKEYIENEYFLRAYQQNRSMNNILTNEKNPKENLNDKTP